MTKIQEIFFGVLIGLLVGLIFFITLFYVELWQYKGLLYILYVIMIAISIFIYNGDITFRKVVKSTTNDDWTDEQHIRWIFNRLRHVHKDEEIDKLPIRFEEVKISDLQWAYDRLIEVHGENKCYDYMLRLKKIINKYEKK